MPSPFPGMDPYLEAPDIWPDLHHALAVGIAAELNRTLPAAHYAEIRERPELGIDPDIGEIGRPIALPRARSGRVAVAARTRREASPHVALDSFTEPIRHLYVEVRDVSRGHKVITVIEILSPSNKGRGNDREVYETKQREVLESDANLIELDLLRCARRIIPDRHVKTLIEQLRSSPAYIVLVNRAWRCSSRALAYNVYPVGLRDPLPCIWVPLEENEGEVALDLQYVFDRVYDAGPYRRGAVDYAGPVPAPALTEDDATWAAELTRRWREVNAVGAGAGGD
jgi:Protein of unknown function (DUF4058)